MILSVFLVVNFALTSCSFIGFRVFTPTPELTIERYQSKLSDNPILYCNYFYSDYHEAYLCSPLVFFPDGSVVEGDLLDDLQKVSDYFSRENEKLYGKKVLSWGRYLIEEDTIKYEHAKRYRLGLVNYWFILDKKKALIISEDSLLVTWTPNNKRAPFHRRDSLIFIKTNYPDINNIDPSKAWINQKE